MIIDMSSVLSEFTVVLTPPNSSKMDIEVKASITKEGSCLHIIARNSV